MSVKSRVRLDMQNGTWRAFLDASDQRPGKRSKGGFKTLQEAEDWLAQAQIQFWVLPSCHCPVWFVGATYKSFVFKGIFVFINRFGQAVEVHCDTAAAPPGANIAVGLFSFVEYVWLEVWIRRPPWARGLLLQHQIHLSLVKRTCCVCNSVLSLSPCMWICKHCDVSGSNLCL